MNFRLNQAFINKARKLCRTNHKLSVVLAKQFSIFRNNPRHPSLKLHKLKGKRSTQYAIWIEGDLRALCIKDGNVYIFFDLVTHDQY